jgi:dihydrofolate reductase
MAKLVVTEFLSLDGVMEDPGGAGKFEHAGWSFKFNRGEEGNKFKFDETKASDALLLGRVTYEGFAEAWPKMQGEFANMFNKMPKYVVSTTLKNPKWNNSTVITGDLAEEVAKLKRELRGDIVVHGSGQLVRSLLGLDLVDEWRLMVFPVILGKGKRLFEDGSAHKTLKLTDSKPVGPEGVIILTYQNPDKA